MTSITFLIIAILVTFLASIVKSIAGFGFSLIAVPIFSYFIGVKEAVILSAFGDLLTNLLLIFKEKDKIKGNIIKHVLPGLIVGTFLGVTILEYINVNLLKKIFGGIVIFMVIQSAVLNKFKGKSDQSNYLNGSISGFVAGLSGGILNVNGPPLVIYFGRVLKDKVFIRATLIAIFLIDSIWRISLMTYNKMVSMESFLFIITIIAPALILGKLASEKLDCKVKNRWYAHIIKSLLFASGMNMIIA